MAEFVRLFGRIHANRPGRKVEQISLRVRAVVPAGGVVKITDVQAQPGVLVTGWTLHPSDLGVGAVAGWHWRNAVVSGNRNLVIAADVEKASPTLWDVRGSSDSVRVGGYFFGPVDGGARVNGKDHTASQGAGIPPHLTERADVDVDATVAGRVLLCCWFRGYGTPSDLNILPPAPAHQDGPVTEAHARWGVALAAHPSWQDLRAAHPNWS